jgi:hypothetical protein
MKLAAFTTKGARTTRTVAALGRCELPENIMQKALHSRGWELNGPGVQYRDVWRLPLEFRDALSAYRFFGNGTE